MKASKLMAVIVAGYLLALTGICSADALTAPEKVIIGSSEKMLKILKDSKGELRSDRQKIFQLVEEIIMPHIDIEKMSRWVLGKYWRKATDTQRQRFTQEFRTLLLRTYSTAMFEYSGQTFKYHPVKMKAGDNDVTIKTELQQPGGYPIPVSYGLHIANGAWKVYDINIDGISLVANYRTSFSAQVKRGGLQQLIDKLVAKNKRVVN